jgi:O-antigen/teichoic acid export membrane protein
MNPINSISAKTWFKKGTFAVLDQGLFSGANFLVNILLARWLPPEEYGAFAVALSVFYLLAGFHTAVLTEPMMVFGAGKYRGSFRKYLGMLIYGHWGISAIVALALGIGAFVFAHYGSPAMARALAGLAVTSPFLLLIWLVRRACYVPMKPVWAAVGSGVNLVVTLVGLFLLWRAALLSSFSGLVLLGIAAVAASVSLSFFLRPQVVGFAGNPTPAMVLGDHWGYGSWNLVGMLAYWASGQILMLLIPAFLGLAASAAVAAVWNLYRPVSLLMNSLGLVLLPVFSRWVSEGTGGSELRRRAMRFALLFGGAVALYGLLLTVVAKPLLHLLYAGRYDEHWLLVGLFGLSTAASVATGLFLFVLKALGRTQAVSEVWGLSAVLVSLSSIPFMQVAGLEGAILSAMISYSVACWMAYSRLNKAMETPNTEVR